MTTAWILVWFGYEFVDGIKFPDKETCRTYAISRIEKMVPLNKGFWWRCENRTFFGGVIDPNNILAHENDLGKFKE